MQVSPLVAFGVFAVAAGSFAPWTQEPAPVPQPVAPAPVSKPVPGTPERHPLEGVFELRRRRIDGRIDDRPSRGFVAITRRHLFVSFLAPGPDADHPLLRSGVRTWTPGEGSKTGDGVETVVKLGWFTDAEGVVHLESPGTKETRRLVLERGVLRIVQDDRNELELERIE